MNANKTLLILASGVVVGGLAVASINTWVRPAIAQRNAPSNFALASSVSTEDLATLRGLDQSFSSLAEFVSPSVVNIRAEGQGGSDVFGQRMGAVSGVGTGVIFKTDGWIITNDHVVNGFSKVTVTLNDGREFKGTVKQVSESDIAVVKIDATGLTAASFADSSKVRPGQFAMAVGSPFGLESTVTFGHVSALGRQNQIPDSRMQDSVRFYPDLIQTDAPINQGNSGGPLFNIDGQVIGINTAIASASGGSNGIGFAIPANLVKTLADTLIEKGKVTRAALGLNPVDLVPYRKKELGVDGGALVESVEPGSPAEKAGIKKDDVIVRIGDMPVHSQMDVRLSMYKVNAGQKVNVDVIRDGQKKTFNATAFSSDELRTLVTKNRPTARIPGNQNPQGRGQGQNPFENMPDIDEFFRRNQRGGGNDMGDDAQPRQQRTGSPRLGVGVSDITESARKQFSIPTTAKGALIGRIEPGSVAEEIGLEPGMVIHELNGKQISSSDDIVKAMEGVKWGDRVHITYSKYSGNSTSRSELDVKISQ